MPFNELQRRDSWPPTVVRLHDEEDADGFVDLSDIDEDPFSFFLAKPEDSDDSIDADEDLSAGIETSSSKPAIREVSPSSLQRVPLPSDDDDEDDDFALEMPLTLRSFSLRHTSGKKSRAGHYEPSATGLGISIPENVALRGRPRARLSPAGNGGGRTRARSLSARRPQSWRLPSPEMWSIIEEEPEDDTSDAGTELASSGKKEPTRVLPSIQVTEPSPIEEPAEGVSSPSKKKKKVHWAL